MIAALPLLSRPGLPRHTDLELHVFRAAEYQRVLSERPLDYPRWAPDFYYGYGYPIFNYYAPLPYFAASLFARIPGVGIVGGMKGVLSLAFALAAFGTYFLARRHFGANGGVVAAAAYLLSPYLVFIEPFMRGDAAEFLALGILPWVFLAFDRPLRPARAMGCASLALAALVFSHNLMAIFGAVMLAGWLLWRGLRSDGVGRWPRDGAAITLALGLTAALWLPFIAERDAVRLDVAGPGHFDFHNHFVELGRLLQPSPALDLGATTPHFVYNLGLPQWLLALPALAAFRRRSDAASRMATFFLAGSALLIFLMTPLSTFLWEAFSPAALVQFPWRFLGPAALMLAMCAGYTVALLGEMASHLRYIPAAALIAMTGFSLPALYPPLWEPDFGDTSPCGMIEFELSGVALGTTSTGDFLPVTVSQLPAPADSVVNAYRSGSAIDRLDYSSLEGGRVTPLRLGDFDARYAVDSLGDDAVVRFNRFAFPGWQAYVDGQPVPMLPPDAFGLIRFNVPASARGFDLRFESTPPRTIGSAVSGISALALLITLIKPARPVRSNPISLPDSHSHRHSHSNSNTLLVTLTAFLCLKILVLDRCDTCFRYTSPPGEALAASTQQRADFGKHIELLGFDAPQAEVEAGQIVPLTLYWRATAPVPINYQVFAHVTRPATILWGQSDKLNPGDFPTTRWPLDKYIWDDHRLRILPGTPPGDYTLIAGLYTLEDGRRAPVFDGEGKVTGDSVQLSLPLHVTRPARPPAVESLGIQIPLAQRAGDVMLLGASIEQATLRRPNFARLTLFWQALKDAPANLVVRAHLIDEQGRAVNEVAAPPAGSVHPMPNWQAREIVRDVYAFWLPPDFSLGRYSVQVDLLDGDGQLLETTPIGTIEVIDE